VLSFDPAFLKTASLFSGHEGCRGQAVTIKAGVTRIDEHGRGATGVLLRPLPGEPEGAEPPQAERVTFFAEDSKL